LKYSALILVALAIPAFGQVTRVQLDPAATQVNFTLGDVLHTVHGVFKLKSGDLWFDPSSGKAGGQIVVNAMSGDSGNSARDSHMHKDILESGEYVDITFQPGLVEGTVNLQGDSNVRLRGQFAIHGGTHELTMAVKSHIVERRLTAVVTFPVPYVQWGMKNPSKLFLRVNDTVEISIQTAGQLILNPPAP
jgi:polyisoprenoid-binding protein YceI